MDQSKLVTSLFAARKLSPTWATLIMTSLQPTIQVETGITPGIEGSAEHSSSVNDARSLGAELMELFVRKQADEVSMSVIGEPLRKTAQL